MADSAVREFRKVSLIHFDGRKKYRSPHLALFVSRGHVLRTCRVNIEQLTRLSRSKRIDVSRTSRLSALGDGRGFLVDRTDSYECRDPNASDMCSDMVSLESHKESRHSHVLMPVLLSACAIPISMFFWIVNVVYSILWPDTANLTEGFVYTTYDFKCVREYSCLGIKIKKYI